MLKAGTAVVDITPPKGVQLEGYPHCPRPNTGAHDPLYASCLLLKNETMCKAFVTFDLLAIRKTIVSKIRSKFPDMNLTFSVSHTHSAPRNLEPHDYEKEEGIFCDHAYIELLEEKICQVIASARENLFDASFGFGTEVCGTEKGIGGNRRRKEGICDPTVNVLAVKDRTGTVRAVLSNYGLHPTYLHAENTLATADYPGYIRHFLKFCFPESVSLFALGCAGDQSSRYHRTGQNFEEAARAGTTIGCAVFDCIAKMKFTDQADIKVVQFEISNLPRKQYPPEEEAAALVRKRQDEFAAAQKTGDYIAARNAELNLFGAQNTHAFSIVNAKGFKSAELPCEVQIIEINELKIVTLPGEIFSEYGLRIKERAGKNTFVYSVSNGYIPGYIYTPEAGREGGYETGTSMFSDDAGEVLLQAIFEKLKS